VASRSKWSQCKTSGQSNLTKGRIAAAHARFNGIPQMTPVCTPLNTCFLGLSRVYNPTGISIGSAIFAQLTSECRRVCPGMSFGDSFPLKLSLRMGRPGSHLITLVPWAHPSPHNPNVGISIGSAVFAGLATVTDSQTDRRRYSVCNNRPHLRP